MLLLTVLVLGLLFVTFRRFEVGRGVRFYEAERSRFDAYAEEFWSALVLGGVPLSWRQNTAVVVHRATHEGLHVLVALLRSIEAPLARLSYKMRVSAPKPAGTPVSDFLKTITPDKASTASEKSPSTI